jgi:hypothetical protein
VPWQLERAPELMSVGMRELSKDATAVQNRMNTVMPVIVRDPLNVAFKYGCRYLNASSNRCIENTYVNCTEKSKLYSRIN